MAAALVLGLVAAAAAEPAPLLRVGTSGDYAPFSTLGPDGLAGFDIDVAKAFARDRGVALEFVPFAWPELTDALAEDRFGVAMSGVTVREDRSIAGRFSVPLLETGALVLAGGTSGADSLAKLDQRGTRIGVNAGGHLERVANATFTLATIVAIPDNAGVLAALESGAVDAVVTDTVEAPVWQARVDDAVRIGPLTRDRKAYLLRADRRELAAELDTWLLAREADGSLAKWRKAHLGDNAGAATATPLRALVAAMDERLALMPSVAAAKRANVLPIAAPARERKVLDTTLAAVREAAAAVGTSAPDDAAVRAFTQAQIDAAKAVQMAAVRDPAFRPPESPPDLDTELRPALLRIGERLARLVVALPEHLPAHEIDRACRDGLRAAWLAPANRNAACAALRELCAAARVAPEPAPESAQQRPRRQTGD